MISQIGAGIDSFFEYSLKTYILLSGLPYDPKHASADSPDAFLRAWNEAHSGIKRHIYRGAQHTHPHYIQVDLWTGALRAFWVDSLSAYYQGLLTLAGELQEAIETHLLYTALWTRYSAMPERWSTATGNIESGLRWWGGRPEFIESTWYLYRATQDPWYLHVGEMALRDIKRRCWTKCGWAGLQDVRTGEKSDRMESFFLGETAKYLFLLFDPSHPLNSWDAPFVFTTEGHPLIIPKRLRKSNFTEPARKPAWQPDPGTCAIPPAPVAFSVSATAARPDIFHAASLARLHLMPTMENIESPLVEFSADHPSISISDIQSPSNYTYYPWTLPPELIPQNAISSKIATRLTFDLSFPNLPNTLQVSALQRVNEGVLVNSMSGLRLGMVREPDLLFNNDEIDLDERFRIYAIANYALGRDERVFMSRETVEGFNPIDPYFTRTRDPQNADLLIDVPSVPTSSPTSTSTPGTAESSKGDTSNASTLDTLEMEIDPEDIASDPGYLSSFLWSLQSFLSSAAPTATASAIPTPKAVRHQISATLPTGPGAAPLPDVSDPPLLYSIQSPLHWSTIYVHSTPLCTDRLPIEIVRTHQVIAIPRGECSFSTKLHNIPSFAPKATSLQLVVIVSFPEHEPDFTEPDWIDTEDREADIKPEQQKSVPRSIKRSTHQGNQDPKSSQQPESSSKPPPPPPRNKITKKSSTTTPKPNTLVQPLLDENQFTPSGLLRPHPIPLLMVSGGHETINLLRNAKAVGLRRKYYFESQGVRIGNLIVL